jgi:hypothetical protein
MGSGLKGEILRATLLFVHGTGVRAAGYATTLRLIEQKVQRQGLPVAVRGCFWGEAEGARLRAGGRSIPGYSETGGRAPTEADELLALWSVLYTDPWYELRLLRHLPVAAPALFGQQQPSTMLRQLVEDFVPSTALASQLTEADLAGYFEDGLAAIRIAPELDQAVATAPADPLDHRRAIARALVAYTLIAAEESNEPSPDGAVRDALTEQLANELHGYGMGVSEFLLRPVKGLAQRLVTRKLTGDRGSITDAAAPAAGDILRFLANGDGVLAFIRQAVADAAPGPVHLLAHSLGGIMCVELLARGAITGVAGLVTVGSQAPFLYEIGALPSLMHPDPLPDHFPPWLNIYDRRDMLSYVGAGVLGKRVTDVEVNNGQPFPQSHSAYWSNTAVWAAIRAVVR